ncbi:MAG TPA: hypothetical protein VN823_14495 [Stellaceae bacterium]|nr:hypothetical protein [Stellaceae bacterium]
MFQPPETDPGAPLSALVARAAKTSTPAAKPARPRAARTATPPKRPGTNSGRLTIAILSGLAIGLVALLIYSTAGPRTPWAFDRPEAKLPSLQAKHTLY